MLAIKNGKLTAAGLSAAGIVPVFGDVARGAKFVSRVALREDDLAEVNKPIDTHWGKLRGARRAEALGIGSALKQLEDLPRIKILCDGRPKAGRPIRDRTPFAVPNGKPIIVEAKGTLLRRQAALSRKALTTPLTVRGQKVSFLQPSAAAIGSDRYARSLDVAPALYLLGERRQLAELLRRHPGEERLIQALEAATDTLRDRDEPHGPWAADTLEELFAA